MKTTLAPGLGRLLCAACIAEELPSAIQADKLLLEAARAIESDAPENAMRALEAIEALDVEPPAIFAHVVGKVLAGHGTGAKSWREARSLLTQFVLETGRESEHYAPALSLLARQPQSPTLVSFRLPDPLAKRLGRSAHLRRHRDDRCPLRFVPALAVQDQPHCPFPKLRGVSV